MTDNVEVRHGVRVLRCSSDGPTIRTDRDAVDVIASSIEHESTFVVIPVERLDEDFFVLKSGIAGAIVQKFVDYRRQLAIVGDISPWLDSAALRDYVYETNRGRQVWILPDLDELDRRLRMKTSGERRSYST
jgi:hypothetical protein